MRLLCVLPFASPFPPTSGGSIRNWNLLLALRSLGDVDVVLLREESDERLRELSEVLGQQRVASIPAATSRWSVIRRALWLVCSDLPLGLYQYDFSGVRDCFRKFASEHYDVVFFADPICHAALSNEIQAPAILDLDDVPQTTINRRLRLRSSFGNAPRYRPDKFVRRVIYRRVDTSRWERYEQHALSSNCRVVVSKEEDRGLLGRGQIEVVPNGYELTGSPVGRLQVGHPPNVLFTGLMTYLPNTDAATYLVDSVLPRMRNRIGQVTVTIAGAVHPQHRRQWEQTQGVVVTGPVPHMEDVLAKADIVAVPLRAGGGTRIKILEAFAHRIPVVSTMIGAEGLGVMPGRELLMADSADSFAAACIRLLKDFDLRRRLVDTAHARYRDEFRWPHIRERLTGIVRRAVATGKSDPC
jgi:polysaccharide biosynthesis protein PslH